MQFCFECGLKLVKRKRKIDGEVPYCEHCSKFRYPMYNVAVSAEVVNRKQDQTVLIQQYGKKYNVLVAGYVDQGESAEEALVREVKEELGLTVISHAFNKSKYFEKTNTLMINFSCIVDSMDLDNINEEEVDFAKWYTFKEAKEVILEGSLAQEFLLDYLKMRQL